MESLKERAQKSMIPTLVSQRAEREGNLYLSSYIPLTNQVRGPYSKFTDRVFPPSIAVQTEKTRLIRYLLYLYCV